MKSGKSIIAHVAVLFMLTACGLSQNISDNTADQQNKALQSTIVALESQVDALSDSTNSDDTPTDNFPTEEPNENFPTPTSESLPTDPIPAGVPIIYDGWSMLVSQEITTRSHDNTWGIRISVRNLGDYERVFRFVNSGITAKNDLGNVYKSSNLGLGIGESCEEYYHLTKNLSVNAGESVPIRSEYLGYSACDEEDGIPLFDGPVHLEASQLIIQFESFGPFDNVIVIIDL